MITQRTFRSHSAELGRYCFPLTPGARTGSAYAAPNRTSALYRALFWMIYRRDAFVAASSISALPPCFLCPPYPTHRERRSRSPAAFILAAQPSPRSPLLSPPFSSSFSPLFSHSISSLYISEWQALVTSSLQSPSPFQARTGRLHISTFGFKKRKETASRCERERENRRERQICEGRARIKLYDR